MKPAAITFLVLTVVTASLAGLGVSTPVLDYKGKPVKPNSPYFIKPVTRPDAWVSLLGRFRGPQCPRVIVLTPFLPVAVNFFLMSESYYVPVSTNLSIKFEDSEDQCSDESGIWKVDTESPFPIPEITVVGSLFSPESTFMIQEKDNENVYKIFYQDSDKSSNLGVLLDPFTGLEHVGLIDTPFDVIFVPAQDVPHKTPSFLNNVLPFIN